MPLMTTKPMFDLAYSGGFAVGAFNVNNMELAQAIVDACAREKSPLILQISKGARKYANIRYLKHIIDAAVEEYPALPIAVHCDHGDTLDLIQACINDGYTSVMIDGSHHPYDENVRLSADAVKLAHANGVVVEAELGMLGGIEEDVVGLDAAEYEKNVEKFLTDPQQAADFYKRTGIDSLAVAIGTSHGAYKFRGNQRLHLDRLEAIQQQLPAYPLVLHGASAVPDYWKGPISALKAEREWFRKESRELFELASLPVLQVVASGMNFLFVVFTGRGHFTLPFKSIDDVLAATHFPARVSGEVAR